MDFADSRKRMVNGQLRPNKVTDPRILAAMLELPRERFLPPNLVARAYADEDVPLPDGSRGLTEPMVLARLVQLLVVREGDRVLLVGAGNGYAAVLLARIGAQVTALEEPGPALEAARKLLPGFAPFPVAPPRLVAGPLTEGWPEDAPYDAILIDGQIPAIPEAIAGQLAEGGRLATVLDVVPQGITTGRSSRAVLGRRLGGSFGVTDAFDCATLPLAAFQPAPGFVF
jgi:protein-L-isoaspartate(D-aspartate) O-methyltransferase